MATKIQNEFHQRGDRDGDRAERDAGHEQRLCPDAVDKKARRRLQQRGDHVEGDEGKAELGIADAIIRADEDEQRRQQDDVIMADEMRRADKRDQPAFMAASAEDEKVPADVVVKITVLWRGGFFPIWATHYRPPSPE